MKFDLPDHAQVLIFVGDRQALPHSADHANAGQTTSNKQENPEPQWPAPPLMQVVRNGFFRRQVRYANTRELLREIEEKNMKDISRSRR